jgi:Xaa-Pro aminopeptidase
MDAARELLRRAEPNGTGLVVDGEPLTSERIKVSILEAFTARGTVADEFIVAHGPQSAVGHDMGSGPIVAGEPVVIDLWPRDIQTACYADMTRTYVVGEPSDEMVRYHALCKEALDQSLAAIRAGVQGADVFTLVCELFHEAGQPTQLSKQPGEVLENGFYHGLGHGVGLEVHEAPSLGRAPGAMVAGDVVTVEPGLYRHGWGGVRLEDLVLVTEDGAENLTEYAYDLEP